jgi:hypothetical protein
MTAQVLAALAELLKLANAPTTHKLVERFLFEGDRYDRLMEEARLSRPTPTEPEGDQHGP